MFTHSSQIYDKIYSFKDYEEASRRIVALVERQVPQARSLLDVGCGTGKHLFHLQETFDVEGLDLDAGLIEAARANCPDVVFTLADMTDFALPRQFDVVTCLFSAIGYVKTKEGLRKALERLAHHTAPGGLVLVEPWFTPEQFWTGHITANFHDEPDLKIAWMYTSRAEEDVSILDIHYMVGTPDSVSEFEERHEIGLFTEAEYEGAFECAGLSVSFDRTGLFKRGLYIGRKA